MKRRIRQRPKIWLYEVRTDDSSFGLLHFYLMSESEEEAKRITTQVTNSENIIEIKELGHALSEIDIESEENVEKWKIRPLQELVVLTPSALPLEKRPLHGIIARNPSSEFFSPLLKVRGIIDQANHLYECEVRASFAKGAARGSSKVISFFVIAKDINEATEICNYSTYIGGDIGKFWEAQSIKILGFSYLSSSLLALSW